jgi:hypothetical protein
MNVMTAYPEHSLAKSIVDLDLAALVSLEFLEKGSFVVPLALTVTLRGPS